MSLIISGRLFGSLAVLVAVSFPAFSAEKNAKSSSIAVTAAQQVKEALRAEAAGNNDRRAELLADAFRFASDLPEVNWHQSRVQVGGNWLNIEEAEEQAAGDPKLAEYRKLRDEAGENPKLIRKLARWCLKNGWQDAAKLHYAQLLSRNDIDADARQEAIQWLDLRFVGGTWMSGEAVKAEEERGRAIEAAILRWRPRLKQLQQTIDNGDIAAREKACQELQGIDDPQAIIVLESFQLDGGDRFCEEAVKRLAQFPQIEATHALTRFAVMSPFVGTRDAATKALKDRTKHDYVPILMSGLVGPIQSQFAVGVDRSGTVQYVRTTVREDAQSRRVLVENRPTAIGVLNPRSQRVTPVFNPAMRAQGASVALNKVAWDVQERELQNQFQNARVSAANRHVFEALEGATGEQIPREPARWWSWWQDYNEYNGQKPTYCVYQDQPTYVPVAIPMINKECFLVGTPVLTATGTAPIESLQAGDRVLSQNQDSGEIAYKLVLRTIIRPQAKMVRISAGGEQIATTLGHPFWVAGHGWKMSKELKVGDLLHSLDGAMSIVKVEPTGEDKAYNLVVEDFNTYFVGQQRLLVHDNEFRKPTRAVVPGLIEEPIDVATATTSIR